MSVDMNMTISHPRGALPAAARAALRALEVVVVVRLVDRDVVAVAHLERLVLGASAAVRA